MSTLTSTPDVYISYAGNDLNEEYAGSRDEIINKIAEKLKGENFRPREYKRDIQYKDSINEFMDEIAAADFIILVISEKYLKSEYCMYEAVELLSKNKGGLKKKIFPVVLQDAMIFDTDKHLEYVDFWDKRSVQLKEKLKGQDPLKVKSLLDKNIVYREISENIDTFLAELNRMCQLAQAHILQNNYDKIIEAIKKQRDLNIQAETTTEATVVKSQLLPSLPTQLINTQADGDVRNLSNLLNVVLKKVDDRILDSESSKREFIDINFEEISSDAKIQPATLNFIFQLRTEKENYEPYRQSLIISALSLGLIKKYDEKKATLLIDFAKDDDPILSNRAIAGLILGLLDKENYISDDIRRKLETLKDNSKLQRILLVIFFLVGNAAELSKVAGASNDLDYNKVEFFNHTQHWFQPFYENNPILKENIPDKKFAKEVFESKIYFGISSVKYVVTLLYSTFKKENLEEFKKLMEQEKATLGALNTGYVKNNFLTGLEVSQLILEFYIYALNRQQQYIVDLIEDHQLLRIGYLYQLVLDDKHQNLLNANHHLVNGKFDLALEKVKLILEDQPNDIDSLLLAGACLYSLGKFAELIPVFEKVKAKGILEIQVYAYLGDAYYNLKEFEKAIENYEALLKLQQNVMAVVFIGRSYQQMQSPDLEKALQYYLRALELDPLNYLNLLTLGDYYAFAAEPDFKKGLEYYEQALVINPKDPNLLRAMTYCVVRIPDYDVEESIALFSQYIEVQPDVALPYIAMGDQYQREGHVDYERAIEFYDKAFVIDPNNIFLIKAYANCLSNLEKPPIDKAEKVFRKWMELEPTIADPYLYLGDCYKAHDRRDLAFDEYFKGFEINPYNLKFIHFLDRFMHKSEIEYEKLFAIYSRFIELDPENPNAYSGMGYCCSRETPPDYAKTFSYYLRSFELSQNGDLVEVLFACAERMEDYDVDLIQQLYAKYKDFQPNSVKPDLVMANFYQSKIQPDFGKAEEHYMNAFRIDPSDKEVLTGLGEFYQNIPQPDIKKSFNYLNELVNREPDNMNANFRLGWGNFISGNYEPARTFFEKCTSPWEYENAVYQNLGHIALIQHDIAKARELYKKSYQLFGDKERFYNSSLEDFKYIEKAGIKSDEFDSVLHDAIES